MDQIRLYQYVTTYNFGDQISKAIVEWISNKKVKIVDTNEKNKLLAVGSILQNAQNFDTIWGSGINVKYDKKIGWNVLWNDEVNNLNVKAVRGPITQDFLLSKGIKCPKVYGDPAILMPLVYSKKPKPKKKIGIVPHFRDRKLFKYKEFIDVGKNWKEVIDAILECEKIVSSSLHGIIVAEAYGISAVWLRVSHNEGIIKYLDYYLGTGRCVKPKYSLKKAMKSKGEEIPELDRYKLIKAFPRV